MRTIRIYQPGTYQAGEQLQLDEAAAHHVGTVLRLKEGENITLFKGDNREYYGRLVKIHKKQVLVDIAHSELKDRESPKYIHLVQAISKGERMELVMQKATELGVTSITPVITDYCAVKLDKERIAKKMSQWQRIAISACEQSGRNKVPEINPVCDLQEIVSNDKNELKFILHPAQGKNWRDYDFSKGNITLLIGPEGGLSEAEVNAAMGAGFNSLSLGPRVLRTETAAIASLSLLQALVGDL